MNLSGRPVCWMRLHVGGTPFQGPSWSMTRPFAQTPIRMGPTTTKEGTTSERQAFGHRSDHPARALLPQPSSLQHSSLRVLNGVGATDDAREQARSGGDSLRHRSQCRENWFAHLRGFLHLARGIQLGGFTPDGGAPCFFVCAASIHRPACVLNSPLGVGPCGSERVGGFSDSPA